VARLPGTRDGSKARDMLKTKSHAWAQVGLAAQVSQQAARARRQAVIMVPILVAVLFAYSKRDDYTRDDLWIRVGTVIALVVLGWALARDIGRALGPMLFRRMDPGTAGTVGFLLRLATIAITVVAALRIAGLDPRTLAVGGAFTAVIVGMAAQQTLGNLIAGTVLLSARPFRVGDRIRLQGSGIDSEGVVSTLGLLYTGLASGADEILVPNSVVLGVAITPLREPDAVELRARISADVLPTDLQAMLEERVSTKTRTALDIELEELHGDEIVVVIRATPAVPAEGGQLADEILAAVAGATRDPNGGSDQDGYRVG
jgi:small-conductance mechanosensitive channel